MFTQANELRLKSFKEGQKQFLEMGNMDLGTYISNKNMTDQANLVDKYNARASEILKARGGNFNNFTTQDWVELQKGRKAIESAQAKWNSDLEKYKLDSQMMARDGGVAYDKDAWEKRVKQYLNTGLYPEEPLPVKKKNVTDALSYISSKYKGEEEIELTTTPLPGATAQKQKVWANMTKEQAQYEIRNLILSEPGYVKAVIEDFETLPATEQARWLDDTDKSGAIDKGDIDKQQNKLITWAQQYEPYLNAIIRRGSSAYSNVGGGSGAQIDFEFGNTSVKYTPSSAMVQPLGDETFGKYHAFGLTRVYVMPFDEVSVLNQNGTLVRSEEKFLRVIPTGYDEEKDVVTFSVQQDYRSGKTMGRNDDISVPAGKVPPNFIENMKIVVNGETLSIEEFRNKKAPSSAATPTISKGKLY